MTWPLSPTVMGVGGLPVGTLGRAVGFQGRVVLPLDLPGSIDLAMQAGQLQAKISSGERKGALGLLRFLVMGQNVVDVAEAFKDLDCRLNSVAGIGHPVRPTSSSISRAAWYETIASLLA